MAVGTPCARETWGLALLVCSRVGLGGIVVCESKRLLTLRPLWGRDVPRACVRSEVPHLGNFWMHPSVPKTSRRAKADPQSAGVVQSALGRTYARTGRSVSLLGTSGAHHRDGLSVCRSRFLQAAVLLVTVECLAQSCVCADFPSVQVAP